MIGCTFPKAGENSGLGVGLGVYLELYVERLGSLNSDRNFMTVWKRYGMCDR